MVIQRRHHETAPLRRKADVALVGAGAGTGVGAGAEAEADTLEHATYHEKRRARAVNFRGDDPAFLVSIRFGLASSSTSRNDPEKR